MTGVYTAKKKDGSVYYRSNITYHGKHISLGSYATQDEAHCAYLAADEILHTPVPLSPDLFRCYSILSFDKIVSLCNFRDNHIYIGNPIYLQKSFFTYYLSPGEELKFDIDDLFFFSGHRILQRQGHLYVNDYGMQISLLSRYGIKNYAVLNRDYRFVNGDPMDFRYSNLEIISKYNGVTAVSGNNGIRYRASIHIQGVYKVGIFDSEAEAAVAYNKAVDLAIAAKVHKNFSQNYILEYTAQEYADLYTKIKLSPKYLAYLKKLSQQS